MGDLKDFLDENNIIYDIMNLEEGIGVFVKAEFKNEVVEYFEDLEIPCTYEYRCNYEWVVFIID